MDKMRYLFFSVLIFGFVTLDFAQGKNEYLAFIDQCAKEKRTFDCLKKRAVEILDSAIEDESVYVVNEFITIGKDPTAARKRSLLKLHNITDAINSTTKTLDEQLDSKFYEYINSRSVKLYIPGDAFQEARARRKGKGYGGMLLAGMAIAGMMAQMAYGKIALLAGTAMMTAKIALVMSALIGLKKLVSSGGGGGHEVIYATASEHHGGGGYGGGGGWQRAMEVVPPT